MAGCFKSPADLGRFSEPIRSQIIMMGVMQGTPVTLVLCWEKKLIEQGIDHPSKIRKDAFSKAQKQCDKELTETLKSEIQKAMEEEQAKEAI
jgi:hypothetical protein